MPNTTAMMSWLSVWYKGLKLHIRINDGTYKYLREM